MDDILNHILFLVIATDIFALGVLVLFLVNFRITIRRRVEERRFALRFLTTVQTSETMSQVAESLNMSLADATVYCKNNGIESPETRIDRQNQIQRQKDDELKRIMAEEASWRAEQERIEKIRQQDMESEVKKRKERLRKFGIS